MQNKNIVKRLGVWAGIVAAILMIPLLTNAPWTTGDFVFAGVVLFGAASAYEFATRNVADKHRRMAVAAAVLFVVMLIWAWAVGGP